jgi:hypothetical protein
MRPLGSAPWESAIPVAVAGIVDRAVGPSWSAGGGRGAVARRLLHLLFLGSALGPLTALEYPVPDAPRAVTDEVLGDREVLWVDWGAAGGAKRCDAELIAEEQEGLNRFLHSPELAGRLVQIARLGEQKEADLVRSGLAAWQKDYHEREQPTGFPRATQAVVDEVPLPVWAWGLPMDIRTSTQVLVFDDRDPAQRAWVIAAGATGERLTFAFCTGWRSGEDRDRFWRAHPGVLIHPVASDDFSVFYGVTTYPARIRFAAETMEVRQGLEQ